jgi:hypothetical protein
MFHLSQKREHTMDCDVIQYPDTSKGFPSMLMQLNVYRECQQHGFCKYLNLVAIFGFIYCGTQLYHILVWFVVHHRNPHVLNGCQCSMLHSHETVVMEREHC